MVFKGYTTFSFLLLILVHTLHAQITVNDNFSPEELIQQLAGKGVYISNLKINCPSTKLKPYGHFDDNTGFLGIESGLILSCGAAALASGPNNSACATQENGFEDMQDNDLKELLTTEKRLSDICNFEFDITVNSDILEFNYVFGSDEYLEYVSGGYHDVFGFFISGPGITGKKNIALLPGTNIPIDVNTINDISNPDFYIDNGTGSTPFIDLDVQYDGFTKVLKAKIKVIPCNTYHLKLAIADVLDATCDSGVFLENRSLKSENYETKVIYQFRRFRNAIEGCNKAYVVFKRTNDDKSTEININYLVKGNAVAGVDYKDIPSNVTIPINKDSVFIEIDALQDASSDAGEMIKLVVLNSCPALPPMDSVEVKIEETFPYKIMPQEICPNGKVQLNKDFTANDSVIFAYSQHLNCHTCPNPIASPPATTVFHYKAIDKLSFCEAVDSVRVRIVNPPTADFRPDFKKGYTTQDIQFTNLSKEADSFSWDFGDQTNSTERDPFHSYQIDKETTYNIELISINSLGCKDTADRQITVYPVFVPNLLTINDDGKNDFFKVIGIEPGIWGLSIYNRWGALVYQNEEYGFDWNGNRIEEGVYYYFLENPSKDRSFKGWVQIFK
ncbi:MAG TPA: choice-of-anchor L domain-containing protein [Cytophagaceae bacterium]